MAEFFVYLNRVHKYAKVHRGECIFCDHGVGLHHKGTITAASEWLGPVGTFGEAVRLAERTGREPSTCANCAPS